MHQPVVIAAFKSESEARAAKQSLLAQEIEADECPRSETMERIAPDIFDDGYDVFVDAADADRAIAVLRRLWPDVIDIEPADRCPECGSTDLATFPRLLLFIAAAVVLFTISLVAGQEPLFFLATAIIGAILLLAPNRRCRSCGTRWRAPGVSSRA